MASQMKGILDKLRARKELTDIELRDLQVFIDVLESRASKSHHDTTSHHHTSKFADFAEQAEEGG